MFRSYSFMQGSTSAEFIRSQSNLEMERYVHSFVAYPALPIGKHLKHQAILVEAWQTVPRGNPLVRGTEFTHSWIIHNSYRITMVATTSNHGDDFLELTIGSASSSSTPLDSCRQVDPPQ